MRLVVAFAVALTTATSAGAVMTVPTQVVRSAVMSADPSAGRVFATSGVGQDAPGFTIVPETAGIGGDPAAAASVVPDAMSWSLLLIGFGLVGLIARRRRRDNSVTA